MCTSGCRSEMFHGTYEEDGVSAARTSKSPHARIHTSLLVTSASYTAVCCLLCITGWWLLGYRFYLEAFHEIQLLENYLETTREILSGLTGQGGNRRKHGVLKTKILFSTTTSLYSSGCFMLTLSLSPLVVLEAAWHHLPQPSQSLCHPFKHKCEVWLSD